MNARKTLIHRLAIIFLAFWGIWFITNLTIHKNPFGGFFSAVAPFIGLFDAIRISDYLQMAVEAAVITATVCLITIAIRHPSNRTFVFLAYASVVIYWCVGVIGMIYPW